MAEPRGPSGTVRGLPAAKVDKMVQWAVQWGAGTPDGEFTREEMREAVRKRFRVTEHQADGIVFQVMRLPGIYPAARQDHGRYRLPDSADLLAKHRRWRLPAGRLNLAEVLQLLRVLEVARGSGVELLPGLEETDRRAREALKHLGVKAPRRSK